MTSKNTYEITTLLKNIVRNTYFLMQKSIFSMFLTTKLDAISAGFPRWKNTYFLQNDVQKHIRNDYFCQKHHTKRMISDTKVNIFDVFCYPSSEMPVPRGSPDGKTRTFCKMTSKNTYEMTTCVKNIVRNHWFLMKSVQKRRKNDTLEKQIAKNAVFFLIFRFSGFETRKKHIVFCNLDMQMVKNTS